MIDGSELNVTVGDIFEFKPRTFLFSAVVLPRFFSFDISSYYAPTSLKFFRSNDQYSQWRGSCSGLIKKQTVSLHNIGVVFLHMNLVYKFFLFPVILYRHLSLFVHSIFDRE